MNHNGPGIPRAQAVRLKCSCGVNVFRVTNVVALVWDSLAPENIDMPPLAMRLHCDGCGAEAGYDEKLRAWTTRPVDQVDQVGPGERGPKLIT